jgi:hypothetical protein
VPRQGVDALAAASAAYLDSPAARQALAQDPYWPKWDAPWWHMVLLWELGLASLIPSSAVEALLAAMEAQYLPDFPLRDADLPPGRDEARHVICHCALGTIDQVLLARGVDIRERLPWTRGWYARYALPDGGLNCEKEAYTGSRKSSMLSTLPVLEALLARARRLDPIERGVLDLGARYLIAHRLVRSTRGAVIDEAWLKPCFPRFYEYDVLRGARFLRRWSEATGGRVPAEALADARPWLDGTPALVERYALHDKSLVLVDGRWERGAASSFSLLEAVSAVGEPLPASAWS